MIINGSKLDDSLIKGIQMLEFYGYLKTQNNGVLLTAFKGNEIIIKKTKNAIEITYDSVPHFYMALARGLGLKEGTHVIKPKVDDLGFMLECSRNAVAKPDMVKKLICLLVLLGYNYLELYTEDTYELPDEPYFGYKRGRYSADELRDIISFARIFEYEIRPCIQTLAHLSHLANWKPYFDHMDTKAVMLVGDERTYDLVRKSIRFCKEVFQTKRINIGTDEAFDLGLGKYLDIHGYREKHDIYMEHFRKVFEICKEEDIYPEFWGDAFYNTEYGDENIKALFDGTQTPIYWDYYSDDKEFHVDRLKKFKDYAGKVIYAGGLWKWFGYVPDNKFSEKVIDAAFEAVEEVGVEDILMTTWGDNGDECSAFAVIPSMWYAAHKLYPCQVDEDIILRSITGYTSDEWKECERLNHMDPEVDRQSNASKYMLHNDYIVGLLDYNTPDYAGEVYSKMYPDLLKLAKRESPFNYIFRAYAAMAKALTRKATFGKRLYNAYQNRDNAQMWKLLRELKGIQKDIRKFYDAYRVQWMTENKGFGFEVMDVRIGGLIVRADTVITILKDYLEGRTDKIYELEEERLEYFCGQLQGEALYNSVHAHWASAYTVNDI